jgi:hypothetical protein
MVSKQILYFIVCVLKRLRAEDSENRIKLGSGGEIQPQLQHEAMRMKI